MFLSQILLPMKCLPPSWANLSKQRTTLPNRFGGYWNDQWFEQRTKIKTETVPQSKNRTIAQKLVY